LKEHQVIRIGRDEGNDLVMDHVTISRRHAELFIDGDKNTFLTDLNSMYGTFVNNERIANPVLLERNDEVYLGDYQFLDWEWEVFQEKKKIFKKEKSTTWFISNLDIIIIYGLIAVVLSVLMSKI